MVMKTFESVLVNRNLNADVGRTSKNIPTRPFLSPPARLFSCLHTLKPLSDSVWDAKTFGVGCFFLVFFPKRKLSLLNFFSIQ